jgi:hypothetical protein
MIIRWGMAMQSCENLPLTVMTALSAAILVFFAASEHATRAEPRQDDGCGWFETTATAWASPDVGTSRKVSWNPAFPPAPSSRARDQIGCTSSSTTAIL